MPNNMNSQKGNEVKQMILELLEDLRRNSKERKALEEQFRQFELTLEGSQTEFMARSNYFSRQLVAADPVNGIAQIISVAEVKGAETVDLSFATEEMYQLVAEKDRPMVQKIVEAVNGKPIDEAWKNLSEIAGCDEEAALITRCKIYASGIELPKPLTAEEEAEFVRLQGKLIEELSEEDAERYGELLARKESLEEFEKELFKPLSEDEELEYRTLGEKNDLTAEEKTHLNDLATRHTCMDVFRNADKPEYKKIGEDELCNLYRIEHPSGITLEDFIKKNICFESPEEKKVYENIQATLRKNAVTQAGGRGGDPDLFSQLSEAQRAELSFVSKVHVAEQGIESAFQSISAKMLKEIEGANRNINLYERAKKWAGHKNPTRQLSDELEELSVLKKDASFLKKPVHADLYEAWRKDRATVTARQIRKNEQIIADRQGDVKTDSRNEDVKDVENQVSGEEKEKEAEQNQAEPVPDSQADEAEIEPGITIKAMTEEDACNRDNSQPDPEVPSTSGGEEAVSGKKPRIRIFEGKSVIDPNTGETKNVTEVETSRGNLLVDSENFRQMVNQIQERVSDALQPHDHKAIDGAGSDLVGTVGYMLNDVAETIDNGTAGAVADIAVKTAVVAIAVTNIRIDNAISGAEEFTKCVADMLRDHDVFEAFKAGKEAILNTAFEKDSELSLIRPSQDIKLISSLPTEMRNEAMPLANRAFEVLQKIAADDDLTARYCKANTDEIYEGQKSYMDLGVLAVLRNDDDLLHRLDAAYRENCPEQFENNPDADYIGKVKQVAAFLTKQKAIQHEAEAEVQISEPIQEPVQYERDRELELDRSLFDD